MRRLILFFCLSGVLVPDSADSYVTVSQLREFLQSKATRKLSDDEVADRLASVSLSERLSADTAAQLFTVTQLGPKAAEQFRFLAALSSLRSLPSAENPNIPAPDNAEQKRLLDTVSNYLNQATHQLPDFIATRITSSFNNIPQGKEEEKRYKAARMHWVAESHQDVSYHNGHEIDSNQNSLHRALTTWGEFGPVLDVLSRDLSSSHIVWDHWERNSSQKPIAVFQYSISRSASHYKIDYCCYKISENSGSLYFRENPAYSGYFYVAPETGTISKIVVRADLEEDGPIEESGIELEYGTVNIGGRDYVCPLNGTAILNVRVPDPHSTTKKDIEKNLNEVRFVNYHKFRSTVQILPDAR